MSDLDGRCAGQNDGGRAAGVLDDGPAAWVGANSTRPAFSRSTRTSTTPFMSATSAIWAGPTHDAIRHSPASTRPSISFWTGCPASERMYGSNLEDEPGFVDADARFRAPPAAGPGSSDRRSSERSTETGLATRTVCGSPPGSRAARGRRARSALRSRPRTGRGRPAARAACRSSPARIRPVRRRERVGQAGRDRLVAAQAGDFLGHVRLDGDVAAVGRHERDESRAVRSRLTSVSIPIRSQRVAHLDRPRCPCPSSRLTRAGRKTTGRGCFVDRVRVDDADRRPAARPLRDRAAPSGPLPAEPGATPGPSRSAGWPRCAGRKRSAVRRIETGSKMADSTMTAVVASETSLAAPPMTPAMPMCLVGSAMSSVSSVSARCDVVERLERLAGRARGGRRSCRR